MQATRSWIAGLVEGETNFRNTKKSGVEVRISNTDTDIIESCEAFMKQHNVYFVKSEDKRTRRKVCYTLSIRNSSKSIFQYATMLFDLISPAMECRHDEYEQILGASETTRGLSIDVDWLVGCYEAESSFSLLLNNRDIAALSIEISNTNPRIVQKVANNLYSLGCSWHIRDVKKDRERHKQAQAINIYGMKRCKRFLDTMKGQWVSGRNQQRTALMSEFIRSRFDHPRADPYTARERQIIQIMKDLNR